MIHGENPTLLDVTYIRPDKKRNIEEAFEVIYKNDSGEICKSYEPAIADIYIVKPEYRTFSYNKPQERIDRCNRFDVPVSQVRYKIAEEMGEDGLNFIKHCAENRDFRSLNKLYLWPYSFRSDFQPEFYFMSQWYEKYKPKEIKLTKAFIDIETDMMDYTIDLERLSSTAYSPINCVTVILDETNECFTFILKPFPPPKHSMGLSESERKKRVELYNKQVKDHEKLMNNLDYFIKDLHDSFDPTYGDCRYVIKDYEHEIDLIADVFRLINNRKPSFCLSWNMRFDIQYLLERIKVLGYDPASIMCHHDFENPKCYFHTDKTMFQLEKQYDFFYCSSYTKYICQMRLYASIRKSQQMLKSVKLNAIGDIELKDKKIEYPAETNMREFPYVDWIRFIKYNIKDVKIIVGIERKTNDVMTYYMRSHTNLTPYSKIFRETHLLRNVREMYFNREGLVQGNNINIIGLDDRDLLFFESGDDDKDESTFKGAIMADPFWNSENGMLILGALSNAIYANSMDFDMSGFYPSEKIACNMDASTLIYKATVHNEQFISGEFVNRSLNNIYVEKDKYGKTRKLDITGEIINTYASGNILTFGYNYLNLPNVTDVLKDVMRELKPEKLKSTEKVA